MFKAMLTDVLAGVLASTVWAAAIGLNAARRFPLRCLYVRVAHPRRRIRVSVAVALVIRENDDYLLVESRRRPGYWGPVGGAMQYFGVHGSEITRTFDCEDRFTGGPRDLRGTIEGRDLLRFITAVRTGRECEAPEAAAAREFYEEVAIPAAAGVIPFQFRVRAEVTQGPYRYSRDYSQFRLFFVAEIPPSSDTSEWLRGCATRPTVLRPLSRAEITTGALNPASDVLEHSLLLFQDSLGHTFPSLAGGPG